MNLSKKRRLIHTNLFDTHNTYKAQTFNFFCLSITNTPIDWKHIPKARLLARNLGIKLTGGRHDTPPRGESSLRRYPAIPDWHIDEVILTLLLGTSILYGGVGEKRHEVEGAPPSNSIGDRRRQMGHLMKTRRRWWGPCRRPVRSR